MVEKGVVGVPRGKSQLRPLTSLRFFAALGVVMYHFGGPLFGHAPRAAVNVFAAGYVGVSFFFVLSGFVLAYAYNDLDSRNITAVRSFLSARVARIYPAYLLSIVLCAPFAVAAVRSANSAVDAPTRLVGSGLAALGVLQGWFPNSVSVWNFPAWSLSVELFLYLTFPYAIARIRGVKTSAALFVTLTLTLVSALFFAVAERASQTGQASLISQIAAHTPLPFGHVPQFLFGIVVGVYFSRERASLEAPQAGAISIASLLGILMVLIESPHVPHAFIENGLLAPLFGALIFGLACGGGPLAAILSPSWLVKLGDASYAIYVLQVPIHDWAMRWSAFNPNKSLHVLAYLATLTAASLAVHRFVEIPGRRLILDLSSRVFAPARLGALLARRRRTGITVPAPGMGANLSTATQDETSTPSRATGP
jgi:peptidoglycan/LPS O-acetylase OafA/YrhL